METREDSEKKRAERILVWYIHKISKPPSKGAKGGVSVATVGFARTLDRSGFLVFYGVVRWVPVFSRFTFVELFAV